MVRILGTVTKDMLHDTDTDADADDIMNKILVYDE
jgi:hypothetical protein